MKITKPGAGQVKPTDYTGNKAVCRTRKAEGEIQGSDVREILFRGAWKKPMIKCQNCGGWMDVEK